MKLLSMLFTMAFLLSSGLSIASDKVIRVSAWGNTETSARHAAFTKAIEEQVGTLLLSDREIVKYELIKNDIYTYSAGYITYYKIISTELVDNGARVVLDVIVNSSKIKNNILIDASFDKLPDIDQLSATSSTYIDTKSQEDKLIKKITGIYPEKAYDVKILRHKFTVNADRKLTLGVTFTVRMNEDYASELENTIDVVENKNSKLYALKVVFHKHKLIPLLDTSYVYYINDNLSANLIYTNLDPRSMRVKISVGSSNHFICNIVDTYVKQTSNNIDIGIGNTGEYYTELSGIEPDSLPKDGKNIMAKVVKAQDCIINTY